MKPAKNTEKKRQTVNRSSHQEIQGEKAPRKGTFKVPFRFSITARLRSRGLPERSARSRAAAAVLLLFALLACLSFFLGTMREEPLPGVQVVQDPAENCSLLLFEEQNGSVILAYSEYKTALLLRLNAATGEVEARRELDAPLSWAALRGGTLFIREDPGDGPVLAACDPETLEEVSCRKLELEPDDLAFFDCDRQGNAVYAFSQSPAFLRTSAADGETAVREFPAAIEFLEIGNSGRLWVCAGETLYSAEPGGEFREIPCLGKPYHLLGTGKMIDRDGVVYKLTGASPEPVFQCPDTIYDLFSFCLDRENCLIVSKPGGGISRYGPDGESLESCRLEQTALAVCGAGGLYRREDGLYYSAFSFSPQASSISPSPSPTDGAESLPAKTEGNFIIMPAGATADQLRELLKPEAVMIWDSKGNPLTSGRLATGMTAGEWVLVIEGDCNGTGTVNTADLREALSLSLLPSQPENPCYRAADLNDDGTVDTQDLLLLSAMVS